MTSPIMDRFCLCMAAPLYPFCGIALFSTMTVWAHAAHSRFTPMSS
jgi:hypothetical protein